MLKVRVPATSANLGPGFDCMGMALTLYNTFTAEPSDELTISLTGTYTRYISTNKDNLLWTTMCRFWEIVGRDPQPLNLTLENDVPPTRGLGSSSTAVVGGLMLANALTGFPLQRLDLLKLASDIEGHPDNVVPAFLGGITLTVQDGETFVPRLLTTAPDFKAVVVIPDILVETEKARAILPRSVSRQDVIFNTSRVGLLVDAFLRQEYSLLAVATQDRIHQNQRIALVPGLEPALRAALDAGAYGAALSGSGPALLAFCPDAMAERTAETMLRVLQQYDLKATSLILDVDPIGVQQWTRDKGQWVVL